jgi:hypothetical protein
VSGETSAGERTRPLERVASAASVLAVSILYATASGCGDSAPPPVSPVVAVDSEEGRRALAEDQATQDTLKQKQAKVARKKKRVFPVEPE